MSHDHAHRHPGTFSTTLPSAVGLSQPSHAQEHVPASDNDRLENNAVSDESPHAPRRTTREYTPDFSATPPKHRAAKRYVSDGFDARPNKSKRSSGFLLSSSLTSLRRRPASNTPEKASQSSAERRPLEPASRASKQPGNVTSIRPSQDEAGQPRPLENGIQEYTPPHTPVYQDGEQTDIKGKKRLSSSHRSDGSSAQAVTFSDTSNRGRPPQLDGVVDRQHQRESIDASQLVRMALSLSESRKQQLGPGQLASLPSPSPRVVSLGSPPPSNAWNGPRNSLPSAVSTPSRRSMSGAQSPGLSLPSDQSQSAPSPANQAFPTLNHYEYQLSTATLMRAEKAKAHFELFHDYLRLLDHLPPLRAMASAEQSSRHRLGRRYNPLQFIRNRGVRARERQTLDSATAGWADPMDVKQWVNAVQLRSSREGYVDGDRVRLPTWNAPNLSAEAASALNEVRSKAEAMQKQRRPLANWSVAQEDLLADTYWLEEGHHKALIENNEGTRLFPDLRLPSSPGRAQNDEDDSEIRARPDFRASADSFEGRDRPSTDLRARGFFHPGPSITGKKGRVKRQILGRTSRRHSYTGSEMSESDDYADRIPSLRYHRTLSSENVGPLERHMNRIMDLEKDKQTEQPQVTRMDTRSSGGRRMGMSEGAEDFRSRSDSMTRMQTFEEAFTQNREDAINEAAGDRTASQSTTEQRDWADTAPGRPSTSLLGELDDARELSEPSPAAEMPKHRLPRFAFLRSKKQPVGQRQTSASTTGSRPVSVGMDKPFPNADELPDSSRSSLDAIIRNKAPKTSKGDRKGVANDEPDIYNARADNATARSIFKSSRVAELAREATAGPSDHVTKGSGSSRSSASSSRSRQQSPDVLRGSSTERKGHQRGQASLNLIRPSITMHGRSFSADDLREPSSGSGYHARDLPSFVSSQNRNRPGSISLLKRIDSRITDRRRSRSPPKTPRSPKAFDQVPLLELPDSNDVSPGASTTRLPRPSQRSVQGLAPPSRRRQDESDSESDARSTSSRLNKVLRGQGLGGNRPVTGLAGLDASNRRRSSTSPDHRSWSVANARSVSPRRRPAVTLQDVAYAESLLISCGVKARAMLALAGTVRDPPADFYRRAAEACGVTAEPAAAKQEHVMAARMLSKQLQQSMDGFERDASKFRSQTTRGLYDQIGDLRDHAGTRLTGRVRTGADDADAFVARLTSNHTLAVKQVNDQIDKALRSRRRRLRWLSRAGFSALEWIVVAIMWWIWGLVLIVRIIGGIFGVIWGILRWLLCL